MTGWANGYAKSHNAPIESEWESAHPANVNVIRGSDIVTWENLF